MKLKRAGFVVVTCSGAMCVALLAGCRSPVPVPAAYPIMYQYKVESAAQWQAIAKDMWKEVAARLEAGGYHETSVGIEPPASASTFSTAIDGFLMTEIVSHGVAVSPGAEFTITYDTQIVKYKGDRDSPAGNPATIGTDIYTGTAPSDTNTELVVTMSVVDNGSVRIRESKIYYINDGDAALYEPSHGGSGHDAGSVMNTPLVSSNWYSADPHAVLPAAMAQASQFDLIVDKRNGPVHSVDEAMDAAAKHCGDQGMAGVKYLSQGYPTNDRTRVKVVFQCTENN